MTRATSPGRWMVALMLVFAGCAGGDDSKSTGGNAISSGLTANFVADSSPTCGGSPDTLSLRRDRVVGRLVDIGIQVTDCDRSLGIFAVSFEIEFDPTIARCTSTNPCSEGTLLSSTQLDVLCSCDNANGHMIGALTNVAPGGNDTVAPSGQEDIASFSLEVLKEGLGRVDFIRTDILDGTALITMNGSPVPISGLTYSSGAVLGQ